MFKVVLVANDGHPVPEWVSEKLSSEGIDYVCHNCYTPKELEECAGDADVLWLMSSRRGLIVEENMDIFKRAGVVIKCGSGTDNIDHDACTRRGIIVAHTPDDPTGPTSDHFIAMLFAAARQIAVQDRLVRRGKWDPKNALPVGGLEGADLGLIGFGRIGRAIIRKLSGFQMKIRVYDPYIETEVIEAAGASKAELAELLKESQFVLVACPLTEETRGLVGERELRMMRPDAALVNVARAGIVDEESLVKALKEGWIKAAALDVLTKHPPGDELLSLENLTLTPHMGGYPHDYPDGIFATVVDEIIRMSRMQMPRWIVNRDVKPRWNISRSIVCP
ncbi:MAG: D-glycerate dehydrogenase [Armatimonadetes bacterium]|nr:D-glycerate dehydrogenase [Armatimonadota bacterium]